MVSLHKAFAITRHIQICCNTQSTLMYRNLQSKAMLRTAMVFATYFNGARITSTMHAHSTTTCLLFTMLCPHTKILYACYQSQIKYTKAPSAININLPCLQLWNMVRVCMYLKRYNTVQTRSALQNISCFVHSVLRHPHIIHCVGCSIAVLIDCYVELHA